MEARRDVGSARGPARQVTKRSATAPIAGWELLGQHFPNWTRNRASLANVACRGGETPAEADPTHPLAHR